MRKIIGTPAATTGVFVNYWRTDTFQSIHRSIELPADKMVEAAERLMQNIQTRLRPLVSWERSEILYSCTFALRWGTATSQLQLEAHVDTLGIWVQLHPCFGDVLQSKGIDALACWSVRRCTGCLTRDGDYGKLHIDNLVRTGPKFGDFTVTELQHDDPLFAGIPLSQPSYQSSWAARQPREDLVDNIVTITQQHINTMFVAA